MIDAFLSSGRFGSAESIITASAPFGLDTNVSAHSLMSNSIHPLALCNFNGRDRVRGEDSKKFAASVASGEKYISGDALSVTRWFRRDHPLDGALLRAVTAASHRDARVTGRVQEPTGQIKADVCRADIILGNALPKTWANTKVFVARLYQSDQSSISGASWSDLGGVCVVGESSYPTLIDLAASILHESAHNKAYRLFESFTVKSMPQTNEFISIPWWETRENSWRWDANRAFMAAHVYAHVSAFLTSLIDGSGVAGGRVGRDAARATFRAKYLTNILSQLGSDIIDADRRDMLEWIDSSLPQIVTLNSAGRAALGVKVSDFSPPRILRAGQLNERRSRES